MKTKKVSRRQFALAAAALMSSVGACTSRRVAPSAVRLSPGSGTFPMPGGAAHPGQTITVHYHRPSSFGRRSPILIVVPGAGRNGDDYRDAWVPFAEAAGVLVASPSYPESGYDNAAYQLGGVIRNLSVGKPQPGSTPSSVYLLDEDIRFDLNPRREEWLFGDFDRLFGLLVAATGSTQREYDLFGHSAGGQVAHRLALFHPESRARRIVAANAGLYTFPDATQSQPLGLAGLGIDDSGLRLAFARDLTVMLGEHDNQPDHGGSHVHTPLIDQRQGRDRLTRGRTFYEFSAAKARALSAAFLWKLEVVSGVGHDFRGMSRAAAKLLYGIDAGP